MRLAVLLTLLCLTGCMPKIVTQMPVPPQSAKIDVKLGIQQQKNVGDTMITKAIYSTYPGFIAKGSYSDTRPGAPPITKDQQYICMNKLPSGDYVCNIYLPAIPASPANMYLVSPVVNAGGDMLGYFQIYYYLPLETPIPNLFEGTTLTAVSGQGFKRELLYTGRSKESIKILYREFSGDMIRPAFSQDLTYDLSESPIIGFRDIKIKVSEATNTSIKYEVLEIEGMVTPQTKDTTTP